MKKIKFIFLFYRKGKIQTILLKKKGKEEFLAFLKEKQIIQN